MPASTRACGYALNGPMGISRIADYNRGWNGVQTSNALRRPDASRSAGRWRVMVWVKSTVVVQATAIYMALVEAAKNQQKLSDRRILELILTRHPG